MQYVGLTAWSRRPFQATPGARYLCLTAWTTFVISNYFLAPRQIQRHKYLNWQITIQLASLEASIPFKNYWLVSVSLLKTSSLSMKPLIKSCLWFSELVPATLQVQLMSLLKCHYQVYFWKLPNLKKAWKTVCKNMAKRKGVGSRKVFYSSQQCQQLKNVCENFRKKYSANPRYVAWQKCIRILIFDKLEKTSAISNRIPFLVRKKKKVLF